MADADSDDEFDFDEFLEYHQLSKATRNTLRNNSLLTRQALLSLTPADISRLKITKRQTDLLSTALQALHRDARPMRQPTGAQLQTDVDSHLKTLLAAGRHTANDGLNGDGLASGVASFTGSLFDPRAVLTLRSTKEAAVHITELIPDHVKRKLTQRGDQEINYTGLSFDQYAAANMRLLNFLLESGLLHRNDVEFYLAFSANIFDLAAKYTWPSILIFDRHYRELQAHHGFKWGTYAPQLEMQLLQPKSAQPALNLGRTTDYQEDCKMFKAKGICRFGDKCKFRHVRGQQSTPGISDASAAATGAKNA